ncbi:MAG: DNA repair protein RadC [Candidatus Nanohaloarchaea archaeon]|nr:DNA repair protein RadC [Candidatus Nanohaloarchaea archaeon]
MDYRIQDLPASERPRERLRKHSARELSIAELLAIILRTGTTGTNVKQVCEQLLHEMGLDRLEQAGMAELEQFTGIGEVKAGQLVAVFELARRLQEDRDQKRIASFSSARDVFRPRLEGKDQEELHAAFLSPSNAIISIDKLFKGSLRNISVEPRDVVRKALTCNASAIILAHNHPGGNARPTEADISTTRAIRERLQDFDIQLMDHIIVGKDDCTSLEKEGKL